MYFDPMNEYPHEIALLEEIEVSNGTGGKKKQWQQTNTFSGFMDTPTSDRRLEAQQMNIKLDRDLYVPYGTIIHPKARLEFENVQYIAAGELENQGGMNEVLRLPLKKV